MFGGINYKVIRNGTNFMLVHGTKIEVSHWEVRISWSYRCEELLLCLWSYRCEELRLWSLHKTNNCFKTGQVFRKQASWIRGNTWFRTLVCVRREKELEA
jgi:hypothetical protein